MRDRHGDARIFISRQVALIALEAICGVADGGRMARLVRAQPMDALSRVLVYKVVVVAVGPINAHDARLGRIDDRSLAKDAVEFLALIASLQLACSATWDS